MFGFLFGPNLTGKAKSVYDDLSKVVDKLETHRNATRSFCDKLQGYADNYERNFFRFPLNWDFRMNHKICKERIYELEDQYDEINVNYRHAKLLQDDLKYQAQQPGFDADTWLANNTSIFAQVRSASEHPFITDFDRWMRDRIAATIDKVIPDTAAPGFLPEGGSGETGTIPGFDGPFTIWYGAASMASTLAISALSAAVTLNFLRRVAGAHSTPNFGASYGQRAEEPCQPPSPEPQGNISGGSYRSSDWPQPYLNHYKPCDHPLY